MEDVNLGKIPPLLDTTMVTIKREDLPMDHAILLFSLTRVATNRETSCCILAGV